ncbi:IS66 family transposase [Pseudoflavonifractor phocaeensis]|uniref:IS66 family transposase n=1 Tax=Pseudoflavonifractor phocaeensis TaxID=1870988 RepID=UPI003AAB5DB8
MQVLHEKGKSSTSRSYMWLYRTSGNAEHPIVLYEYQPNRKAERKKPAVSPAKRVAAGEEEQWNERALPHATERGIWSLRRRGPTPGENLTRRSPPFPRNSNLPPNRQKPCAILQSCSSWSRSLPR